MESSPAPRVVNRPRDLAHRLVVAMRKIGKNHVEPAPSTASRFIPPLLTTILLLDRSQHLPTHFPHQTDPVFQQAQAPAPDSRVYVCRWLAVNVFVLERFFLLIRRRESGASALSIRRGEHNRHKWTICSTFRLILAFSLVVSPSSPLLQVKPAGGGTTRDVRPQNSTLSKRLRGFRFTGRRSLGYCPSSIPFRCFNCTTQTSEKKEFQSCCKGSAEHPAVCKECGHGYWQGSLVF